MSSLIKEVMQKYPQSRILVEESKHQDVGWKSSIYIDVDEVGQKSFNSKDARESFVVDNRVRELHLDKPAMDDFSSELLNRERTPVRSSSLRPGQPPGNPGSLLPPPPPFRL